MKIVNAFSSSRSFWREVLRYSYLYKSKAPADWLAFRHNLARECALRRDVKGGPPRECIEDVYPEIGTLKAQVMLSNPNPYNPSWEELTTISRLTCLLQPKMIFEFGTFDGRTTLHLALNAPDDADIYTIDISTGQFEFGGDRPYFNSVCVGECLGAIDRRPNIHMLTGDSRTFDFSAFYGRIDLIFIDADHSYSAVMSDSKHAFAMARPGALVVWHDYLVIDDVTRAICELSRSKKLVNIKGTSLVLWKVPLFETASA